MIGLHRLAAPLWACWVLGSVVPARAAWADDGDDDDDAVDAGAETVRVTTSRPVDQPDPADVAAAVTVIEVDERLPASSDVADAVSSVAGVHVQRLGGLGDYSVLTIRGSSSRQVEVFVDGVPLNPYGGAAVNLAELPLDAFERIEVYRSGAPARFGSAALGGVVNLVTATGELPAPRAELTAGSLWTGRVSASGGGAFAVGRGGRGLADGTTAPDDGVPSADPIPADVLVAAEAFATDGRFAYLDDRGTPYNLFDDRTRQRTNADVLDLSARARLRIGGRRARLTIQDDVSGRDQGLPGIGQHPADHARAGVFANGVLAELRTRPRATVEVATRASWRLRIDRFEDPAGELGVGRQDTRDQTHAAGGLVVARWIPLAWQQIEGSAELRVDRYQPVDRLDGGAGGATRTRVGGVLGLADDLVLLDDRLRISPLLQLHLLDSHAGGQAGSGGDDGEGTRGHVAFTPRLGVRVRPAPPLTLKANAGRQFRPPDFLELFGDRGAVVGNPALVPESGWGWDGGLRLGGALAPTRSPATHASLSASYFGRDLRDAIVYVQNAQRTQIPVNLGRARVHGVEAAGELAIAGVVELRTSLTWMHTTNLDPRDEYTGKQLPRVPRWELWGELALRWGDRARLAYTLSHTAGNYWDATNWYLAAPRTLHGLVARLHPRPSWPWVEIELRNLTDERLQAVPRDPLNPGDGALAVQPLTDFSGYPLPGRVVLVTVGGTFGTEGRR